MHPQSTAQQPNTDDQQRWYFTFGAGHEHDGRYVEIAGRYDEARAEMIRHFGTAWCAQYAAWEPSKLSGFPQGLVELLPKDEWPKPDYWLTLADDLRQAADRLATLAGTPAPPSSSRSASLYVAPSVLRSLSGEMTPIIDRIAATFGVRATAAPIGAGSGSWEHKAAARVGTLDVEAYAFIPTPEDAEKAAMRAELEALRAQLAEGGAAR